MPKCSKYSARGGDLGWMWNSPFSQRLKRRIRHPKGNSCPLICRIDVRKPLLLALHQSISGALTHFPNASPAHTHCPSFPFPFFHSFVHFPHVFRSRTLPTYLHFPRCSLLVFVFAFEKQWTRYPSQLSYTFQDAAY